MIFLQGWLGYLSFGQYFTYFMLYQKKKKKQSFYLFSKSLKVDVFFTCSAYPFFKLPVIPIVELYVYEKQY